MESRTMEARAAMESRQSASLVNPKSPSLSLEPLRARGIDPSVSSSIAVRKSYVTMFDTLNPYARKH